MHTATPIAITKVDWKNFIDVCQDTLGFSPTRCLDKDRIDVKSHEAFLATLGFDGDALGNLRNGFNRNDSFNHVHVTFACVTTVSVINDFSTKGIHSILKGQDPCLCIFTASIKSWRDVLIILMNSENINTVKLCYSILDSFCSMGFQESFSDLKRKYYK